MVKNRKYSTTPSTKNSFSVSRAFALVILGILVLGALTIFGIRFVRHNRDTAASATNNTHIAATAKNGKSTNSPQPPATQTNKSPTSSTANNQANQPLQSPGLLSTFASTHTASLSAPTRENTTCVTTPGASCLVEFQQGSTTKSLPAQTTDSSGSAYFFWTPNQNNLKLTPGNWTILLKVTLGGSSKTAQDSTQLQVTP
jgi:hypothetical protein